MVKLSGMRSMRSDLSSSKQRWCTSLRRLDASVKDEHVDRCGTNLYFKIVTDWRRPQPAVSGEVNIEIEISSDSDENTASMLLPNNAFEM